MPDVLDRSRDEPALALFAELFGAHEAARLQIAYLDPAGELIALSAPETCEIDAAGLPIRRIVANALLRRSRGLLLAHTHPSGDPCPGPGAIAATRLLAEVAHPLQIRVIDHFVIAGARWTSFRAMGLL